VTAKRRERLFAGAAGRATPLFEALDADQLSPRSETSHAALHGLYWHRKLDIGARSELPQALSTPQELASRPTESDAEARPAG
jgi:hypothetical protein